MSALPPIPVSKKQAMRPAKRVTSAPPSTSTGAWIMRNLRPSLFDTAKKPAGGMGSAKRNYESAQREIKRLQSELKDEASKGGRGKRYDKLTAQLEKAKQSEQRALTGLQAAEAQRQRQAVVGGLAGVAAGTAGIVVGKKIVAPYLDRRFQQSITKNQKAIAALATEARSWMKVVSMPTGNQALAAANLRAINATARRMLPAARSPLGIGIAAASGGLGAYSIYRASQADDFTSKLAYTAVSGLELGVAAGTIGAQVANRNNPVVTIPAKDIAAINATKEAAKIADKAAKNPPKPVKQPRAPRKPTIKTPAPAPTGSAANLARAEKALGIASKALKRAGKAAAFLAPVTLGAMAISAATTQDASASPRRKGESRNDQFRRELANRRFGQGFAYRAADFLSFGAVSAVGNAVNYLTSAPPVRPTPRPAHFKYRLTKAQAARYASEKAARRAAQAGRTSQTDQRPSPTGWVQAHTRRSGTKIIQLDTRRQSAAEIMARR